MVELEVHYKVKPDKVEEILDVVREFVGGIKKNEPKTRYMAYQSAEDPTRFVHFMSFPDEAAQQYHQTAPHTMKFVDVLYPQCEEQPKFTQVEHIAGTNG